jgi:hydrogenase maturation protease
MPKKKVLVYGYGNPGRQDDALGIIMADNIKKWADENETLAIEVDQNYQLNIEDASKIMDFDLVVFIDASINNIESFQLEKVTPDLKTDFNMHSVSPSFVLGLCREISDTCPQVYQLQVKGYNFEFMQEMSDASKENLIAAEKYLKAFLLKNLNS